MIIIHDIFICKPGNASKLAKKFKDAMAGNNELIHIMTDMSGQYNKVVMVSKYESLTAYEQSWEKYKQDTAEMKKMGEAMLGTRTCISPVHGKYIRSGSYMYFIHLFPGWLNLHLTYLPPACENISLHPCQNTRPAHLFG